MTEPRAESTADNKMILSDYRVDVNVYEIRPGAGVGSKDKVGKQIGEHSGVVGSLMEAQVVNDVLSALINARGRGITHGVAMRGRATADAMRFAGEAVKEKIEAFYDDPVGYCDLAQLEHEGQTEAQIADAVKEAFMELMHFADQFDINFQRCLDGISESERKRVNQLMGLGPDAHREDTP